MSDAALAAALAAMDRPFEWGVADCCTSACDAFHALHGVDPMAPLRGRYRTARGAGVIIARRGGFFTMACDLARGSGLAMGCGDAGEIGVAQVGPRLALVFSIAPHVWAGKSEHGMTTVRAVLKSWAAVA